MFTDSASRRFAPSLRTAALSLCAMTLLAACGGGDKGAPAGETAAASGGAPANAPAPTGKVITIEMITDDSGNYFKPKDVEAHPGDVLKFVLVQGVHNVHFLPDSNPGAANLPAASTFAQLPQQAIEIPVTMAPGKSYYFQCDPHAALGMVGHVKVEQ